MLSRRRALAGGLAAVLAAPAVSSRPALAKLLSVERIPAETFTLGNGLQVIVLPSKRAPILTQLVIYKVGSADEQTGKTGIAHFLEHMMFKGTKSVGPGEFSRLVSRNGGRDNAFTDNDVTGYHQTIAADRLELVMRMEADRMANLEIVEKELTPEREVVLEERRMRIDNSPSALLDEQVRAELFGRDKPYGTPTAGFVEDVRKLSVDDLADFYRHHYAPNNAVLIVAGDTTADAVHKLADTYYGPIQPRTVPPRVRPETGGVSLPQSVARADQRVGEPSWGRDYLAPSYHMGETRHAYALQVLARLFGGSETSRLWRALVVDKKVALSVSANYSAASLGLSSFGFDAAPAPTHDFAAIERVIDDEMKKVLDGAITAEEVERTQNRLLSAAIYAQDSLGSGPRRYGAALSTGGSAADVEAWPERIAAVRPADVVEAARHVWRREDSVTSELTPARGAAQ